MTKGAFTLDRVVRAIQDGEMPDGREIHDDEAYLNALAAELEKLDPDDLEAVMEATGCDVAAAKATAERISDLLQNPVCTATSSNSGFLGGFSLEHEVLLSNLAVACNGVVLSGKEMKALNAANEKDLPPPGVRGLGLFTLKPRVREEVVIPSNNGSNEAVERLSHLLASTQRDRHADIDGD